MTRLLQWLLYFGSFFVTWAAFCHQYHHLGLNTAYYNVILFLPIYLLIAFACYSLTVIGYRVYKFNDCQNAAMELKEEIEEARKDLKLKGFCAS